MGNSASTDAAHKESRLKNRFSRVTIASPASSAQATNSTRRAAAPRRSSAAKDIPEPQLGHSETRLELHQDAALASPAPRHSLRSIAPEARDRDHPPSSSHGQPRPNNTRTWSLDTHNHSSPANRTTSLTRAFSLSRARSLIHQRRSYSLTSEHRPGSGHEHDSTQQTHALGLVTDQEAKENPYLRTASSQSPESWKPPGDIPGRPNSTGLPLLPRPNSESDMSLFTPARRRSLRTPGVATRAPATSTSRTSKPPSRRNSLARPQPLPILEVSAAAEDDDYDLGLVMYSTMPRATTPNELEFAQVGAYKFGTLRITNGSPSATPDARSDRHTPQQGSTTSDYFTADSNMQYLAEPLPNPVEKLDVRVDYHAKSTTCARPVVDQATTLSRSDSGIETSPVQERPEMRLSKADSGYSSKASVRSSYSEKLSGRNMGIPRSSIDSTADGRNSQYAMSWAQDSPSPETQAFTNLPERTLDMPHRSSGVVESSRNRPAEHGNTPSTFQKLFSLSRRQSEDEGRPADARVSDQWREPQDVGPARSHHHWRRPASAGKGTLNSLFSLSRKSHEPIQAIPYPPQRSRLSKGNKGSHHVGTVGNNLVQAAAAILPIKRAPTLRLKTELSLQLQQDDQVHEDRRFSIPTSPQMMTSIASPTHFEGRGDRVVYNRQAYQQNVVVMNPSGTRETSYVSTSQANPEILVAHRSSFTTYDAARYAPPPVSLKTRHGGSFTIPNARKPRHSLPAQVERSISLEGSAQLPWQGGRFDAVTEPSNIGHVTSPAIQSPTAPQLERRRSMVLNTSQGQHRIPQWDVDTDHHTSRAQQWHESVPPFISRPSSAGSFLAPRIPDKAEGRRVLSKAHRNPANSVFGATGVSRNSSVDSIQSSVAMAPARAPSQGHSRNRSHGSYDRDGNPTQFRVLHSYNSPAYKHVPIWN